MQVIEQINALHEMELKKIADYYNDLVMNHGFDPQVAHESFLKVTQPINDRYYKMLINLPFSLSEMCG